MAKASRERRRRLLLPSTPRGHIVSKAAYDHLGYRASGVRSQNPLF